MVFLIVVCLLEALVIGLLARYAIRNGHGYLERIARRRRIVFVPVSRELAARMQDWSRPVQIQLREAGHPLLYELKARVLESEIVT